MTYFGSISFFVLLLIAFVPSVILGIRQKSQRGCILITSFVFLTAAIGKDWYQALYFLLYLAIELTVLFFYLEMRKKYGRARRYYFSALAAAIAPLALCKLSEVTAVSLFQILGISYMTFKAVQIIMECYDGVITDLSLRDTLAFFLFYPSVSSGPIDRSRRFSEDLHHPPAKADYLDGVGIGIYRILLGLIYKFVLGNFFYQNMFLLTRTDLWYAKVGYAYAYGLYLFFDFAGYSLMACGAAAFTGIRLPMNFNRPFISIDIKEFWDRWHITLSHWLRDFVFSRFILRAIRGKWFSSRITTAACGFLVNMTLMGMWHGLTPSYLLYGLYHGVLLAATEIYQKKSSFYKKHKKQKGYRFASWFVTMQLVMFGFYIFSGQLFA